MIRNVCRLPYKRFIKAVFFVALFTLSGYGQNPGQLPIQKKDFLVNSLEGTHGSDQMYPAIAIDSSGYSCVAWIDKRNGFRQVFAQVIDRDGNKVGHNICVDSSGQGYDSYPLVAASDAGRFVVTWSPDNFHVYVQIIDCNGQKIGPSLEVFKNRKAFSPSVAMAPGGCFMVVGQTGSEYYGNLSGQIFSKDGQPLTNEILINDEFYSARLGQRGVQGIAVDSAGHFAVAFRESLRDTSRIYVQFIDKEGQKIGRNIQISSGNSVQGYSPPYISATKDGVYLIIWGSGTGRLFRFGKGPISDQFWLRGILNWDYSRGISSCSTNGNNRFFASFTFWGAPRLVSIDTSGTIFLPDTTLHTPQGQPVNARSVYLANASQGRINVSFAKANQEDMDIYLQPYTDNFKQAEAFIPLAEDSSHGAQIHPLTVSNGQGQTLILWKDRRNGLYQNFGRIYQENGQAVGKDFEISPMPDVLYYEILPVTASAFGDGTFVVAYLQREKIHNVYGFVLYLQRINPSGNLEGKSVPVAQFYDDPNLNFHISCSGQNAQLFYWQNHGSITSVYAIRFNRDFNVISKPVKVFPTTAMNIQKLAVSSDSDLNTLFVWRNNKKDDYVVYAQIFSSTGQAVDSAFVVVGSYIGNLRKVACRMISKDEYVIAVQSSRLIVKRYYRIDNKPMIFTNTIKNYWAYWDYNPGILSIVKFRNKKLFLTTRIEGTTIEGYYFNDNKGIVRTYRLYKFSPVSGIDYFDRDLNRYSASISGEYLWFAYQSNRHGETNFDIWAKILRMDSINFEAEQYIDVTEHFDEFLLQNAPNPFNLGTRIAYYLPAPEAVSLTVYNTLGQKIAELQHGFQSAGWHTVHFDASQLASGIYFCRLQGFRTKMIKMVLLK